MGSTSLPALKAFLRGEQWFRRASWDSAMASYDAAIALDSMFPLPLWRSGLVLGWSHEAGDSVSVARVTPGGRADPRAGAARQPAPHGRLDPGRALPGRAAREPGGDPAGARDRGGPHAAVPGRRRVVVPSRARPATTGEPPQGTRPARRSRRSTAPSGSTPHLRRPTSTRSSSRSGSTAPRQATAMPRATSPSAPPTPRRRASAWPTSSWSARGRGRQNTDSLLRRGDALGPAGRVARPVPRRRLQRSGRGGLARTRRRAGGRRGVARPGRARAELRHDAAVPRATCARR